MTTDLSESNSINCSLSDLNGFINQKIKVLKYLNPPPKKKIGITTHNPDYLEFPQTMTNLSTGTIMMSGCGILVNGKGSRREYGQMNLDELKSGDRVGLVRRSNNDLHYFINGCDQGVATTNVPADVWAVIDLYGMTTKVTIVEHDNRSLFLEYNSILEDLEFDTVCGLSVSIGAGRKTAIKDCKMADLDNGVVFSSRPLFDNELFEIRLDNSVSQWWEDIEIGVTGHNPTDFGLPVSMLNFRNSKTWLTTGKALISKSNTPTDDLLTVENENLQIGDRIGVMRTGDGELKFFLNGLECGLMGIKVPEIVYAILNLCCTYGQVTLLKQTLKQNLLSLPNAVLDQTKGDDDVIEKDVPTTKQLPENYKFSTQHGKNINIKSCGTLAIRLNNQTNQSSSILPSTIMSASAAASSSSSSVSTLSLVFSETELITDRVFEVLIVTLNSRLVGNLRIGVCTKKQPLCQTVENLEGRLWYVSGCNLYADHEIIRYEYLSNLNYLEESDRVSIWRTSNVPNQLRFGVNGQFFDVAAEDLPEVVYVFVELYGACTAIKIEPNQQPENVPAYNISTSTSNKMEQEEPLDGLKEDEKPTITDSRVEFAIADGSAADDNVLLTNNNCTAERIRSYKNAIVFVKQSLQLNSVVEIIVEKIDPVWNSTLSCGLLFDTIPNAKNTYNLFTLKNNCILVTDEYIFTNGTKIKSSYGHRLANITNNSLVTLRRTIENRLEIALNGESFGDLLDIDLPKESTESCWPLFNLYGQCVRISLNRHEQLSLPSPVQLPNDIVDMAADEEKASLECAEKLPCSISRVSPSVSSSIFSSNNDCFAVSVAVAAPEEDDDDDCDDDGILDDNPLLVSATSVKYSPSYLPCPYLLKSIEFFNRLFIPEQFSSTKSANCFCINCYQFSTDDDQNNNSGNLTRVSSPQIGWVKYSLKNENRKLDAAFDNWIWAFYITRPGLVRQILDLQQLLTEDEQTNSYFVRRNVTDSQPSIVLLYKDFRTAATKAATTTNYRNNNCENHEAFVIVQLRLRPGSFDTHQITSNETETIQLHNSCISNDILFTYLWIQLADN